MSPLGIRHICRPLMAAAILAAVQISGNGCCPREDNQSSESAREVEAAEPIPRFAKNSPFAGEYKLAVESEGKRLWARSFLWEPAPEFVVEKWLTPKPDMQDRYVLIEYWATWCGPCRRSIPLLNEIHRRFKDRLVVIGISDEPEATVRALKEPRIEYYVAVDTQTRMKTALGVTGVPHAILVEPKGSVVWEGFPLLEGHELTPETVERILQAGPGNPPTSESQRVRMAE